MAPRRHTRFPLVGAVLLALLAAATVYSLNRSPLRQEARRAEKQLATLRTAVSAYHMDHGFYPGSREDFGYPLGDEQLRAKLLSYTDARGQTSPTQDHRFRFGPYLTSFPSDPVHGGRGVSWALGETTTVEGQDEGGWIYAPESGVFAARVDGLQLETGLAEF